MAISTIGTDALASAAVTSAKLASGAPSRSQLPAGTVLQVVSASTTSQVSMSAGVSNAATGLSATITPTSAMSKILVLVDQPVRAGAGTWLQASLYKNGSSFQNLYAGWGYQNAGYDRTGQMSCSYLDSPATTSATTYAIYGNGQGTGTVYFQIDGGLATITLMEIAA